MKLHLLLIVASLSALSLLSCDSRDPEAEFQELSSTVFDSHEGVAKAREYLNHFKKNRKAHLQEVNTILFEYEMMADFARKSFSDYASLISEGQELDSKFSTSLSPGVRNAWYALYKDKRKRTMEYCLSALSEIDFSPELSNAAQEICSRTYYLWEVEDISEVSIGPAELIGEGSAKRCTGTYEIFLRNSLIPSLTNRARVEASGRFSFDSWGNLHFTQEDSEILQGPRTARDWLDTAESWGLLGE